HMLTSATQSDGPIPQLLEPIRISAPDRVMPEHNRRIVDRERIGHAPRFEQSHQAGVHVARWMCAIAARNVYQRLPTDRLIALGYQIAERQPHLRRADAWTPAAHPLVVHLDAETAERAEIDVWLCQRKLRCAILGQAAHGRLPLFGPPGSNGL